MKKRLLLCTCIAVLAIVLLVAPGMVESGIPSVYYVTPSIQSYENAIQCSGTIQSGEIREIYTGTTLFAADVFVEVGDEVREGDTLLLVDRERTEQLAANPLNLVRDTATEPETAAGEAVDWAALAAAYGLSASVNGGAPSSGMDLGALQSLIEQSGLLEAQTTTGSVLSAMEEEIASPIAGVVTAVNIQSGVPAAAGRAIVTIADNKQYKVLATVSEEDIYRVQEGDLVKVRGVGFNGTYTGVVSKVYPTARKALSGTTTETVVDVEISLDKPDSRLKHGFTAKVEIQSGYDYDLVTVPYEAIRQDENNNEYVYLYQDGKLVKQVVVTGQELINEVEIIEGVSTDSVVIYNPTDLVKEGGMIHIKGRAHVD